MRILVTPTSMCTDRDSNAMRRLQEFADEIIYSPYPRPLTEDELIPLLDRIDGIIAGLDFLNANVINTASTLKVISRYGVGYERVDIEAAAVKGIAVTNTPGVNSESVADMAFGLLLAVARRIPSMDAQVRAGGWPRIGGVELFKKRIGIVGLGAIGKAMACRAKGFSMEICAYDPFIDEGYAAANGIVITDMDGLVKSSDIISLHLPFNEHTSNIIDARRLDMMRPGAILINTARGGLIDEDAAVNALRNGKLGGIGLDAFENEPPGESELFEFENVVATPHSASHTKEAVINMSEMSVDNLIAVLSGKECKYIVNKRQ